LPVACYHPFQTKAMVTAVPLCEVSLPI
jgi:hypothetical protein